jgi:hypothetical protein
MVWCQCRYQQAECSKQSCNHTTNNYSLVDENDVDSFCSYKCISDWLIAEQDIEPFCGGCEAGEGNCEKCENGEGNCQACSDGEGNCDVCNEAEEERTTKRQRI